ncbi:MULTISPECIES: TonB-dependent siderophore receptor [unclassified Bradyrhizobium]|jgi:iron complex outermembrane receptor protein|uniref:TonB-dependent siderophore receptor n=1 Tax=unclassified Bradyrhizobium TaxID=2631580 RepID=UPI0003777845|nr:MULTISPECIES: TonB-dependent siderophore receptor [unclassified Bradyrhizobium]MCK1322665.1 TonB-dependent siderophore receptor [Bradyrhizobium sp. 156]MCK1350622.1 TonB-dependent siderophore receptor [Bradyrhizobium sp. CW7]MCK1498241.1 TonB-dependent siderophore receptor [Bradyrhizobium sp. 188]MCK1563867.1 TonB-dependent siderophore receptor [Bradyrhizobium sp. 173]MCK1571134.1 TonB-dependent siderophore receptor [Bradyrhizobium sp. 174]
MLRSAMLATASAWVLLPQASLAQSPAQMIGAQNIPSVTVAAPEARRRAISVQRRAPRSSQQTANRNRPQPPRNVGFVETPLGPVHGYVAGRSSSGTKTNTPIMETPQAVSVIGAEQIRDQKANKLDEVLRYTAGVRAGTFGADTRNDWWLIRGFKSDDVGLFLDGMQLFYTSYASWKLQTPNMERVEVLRGPSAVLYGGSSPSGIVNVISKMPPAEPVRFIETGVNNFGNAYVGFDVGGPVATSHENGKLFYRVVGQVQNGPTQVNFTPDNNYFIAPSVTWKPDADTRFTVLASASRQETRGINFLPYEGTVINARFGKIPTSFFAGDPSVDKFTREQEMLGYQFERNLTDDLTFRQNARFAHVDVTYRGYVGNNWADINTASLGRYNWYAKNTANQANLDNQLEYRFNTGAVRHTMLFGVDLKGYQIDDYQAFNFGTVPSINVFNPAYGFDIPLTGAPFRNFQITQKQAGTYLQDQMKLGNFTLVLSGRNDWVETTQAARDTGATLASRDDSRFSGRAGLIYNFDNGIAPYVSYATSYNPIIGLNAQNQLFLPETGQQTEIGVKVAPRGFDGYFTASVFDLKRQHVATTDPVFTTLQNQTGEVTSRGIEIEAVANATRELKLIGSFTAYRLFNSRDLDPALVGKTPTNTPELLVSGWADYTFKDGPLAGFGFGGGLRYIGSSWADTANTLEVPAVVLGDLALHYEWQNWRTALNVVNLTDKIYVASCAAASSCFYGDRRRVTASVSYKW